MFYVFIDTANITISEDKNKKNRTKSEGEIVKNCTKSEDGTPDYTTSPSAEKSLLLVILTLTKVPMRASLVDLKRTAILPSVRPDR